MASGRKNLNGWGTAALAAAVLVFAVSAYRLGGYLLDGRESEKAVEALSKAGIVMANEPVVYEIVSEGNATVAGDEGNEDPVVTLTFPFTVDFEALRAENGDIAGWLYCGDTKIDYPVMYSEEEGKYLHTRPDGTYAYGGSLFLGSSFSPELSAFCTVIYGHNMKDGSMFGTLRKYRDEEYFLSHPVFYYFSPYGDYMLDVAGVFEVKADSYIYTGIYTGAQKEQLLYDMREHSFYRTGISCGMDDRYVVLSTCTNETEEGRLVAVCRMTEIRVRGK